MRRNDGLRFFELDRRSNHQARGEGRPISQGGNEALTAFVLTARGKRFDLCENSPPFPFPIKRRGQRRVNLRAGKQSAIIYATGRD